jgi:hypothetical protein
MKLTKRPKHKYDNVATGVDAYSSEETGDWQDVVDFVVSNLPNAVS